MENNSDTGEVFEKGVSIDKQVHFQPTPLTSTMASIPGKYEIKLYFVSKSTEGEMEIILQNREKERFVYTAYCEKVFDLNLENNELPTIELNPISGKNILCGIVCKKIND